MQEKMQSQAILGSKRTVLSMVLLVKTIMVTWYQVMKKYLAVLMFCLKKEKKHLLTFNSI